MHFQIDPERNITISHRLSAFPNELPANKSYPLSGILRNITAFAPLSSTASPSLPHPMYACEPLTLTNNIASLVTNHTSGATTPKKIALAIRGHCSFSHKVRVAQARGADALLVADDVRREGEMDEEGRERDGLLTMYSPGK